MYHFYNHSPYHYQSVYGRQPYYWPGMDGYDRFQFLPIGNMESSYVRLRDNGPNPYVVNIKKAAKQNNHYRLVLWTGEHLQVTLMSLKPGEDIGLEIHPNHDQFLRIEQGNGMVQMGKNRNNLNFVRRVSADSAVMIPAGTWHNLRNTGITPMKLYSIYAPPEHPRGTIHETKAAALAAERF